MVEQNVQEPHWSEVRESTTIAGIRFLIFAYRLGGKILFKILLAPVIAFYFTSNAHARRSVLEYFDVLHSFRHDMPRSNLRNGFKLFWEFGLALIDKFSVWMGRIGRDDVVIYGGELIDQQLQRKQGTILLLSHHGNFEVCHALSQTHAGVKLTVLVHTKNAQKFNELLNQFVDHSNIELVQVSELDVGSAMQLTERVSRGEFLAIAGDRVPLSSGATIDVEFLGKVAAFPSGPFILASVFDVPIIMLSCIRKQGTYHIHFDKISEGKRIRRSQRQQQFQQLVRAYAGLLEQYVTEEPFQWFNFYDFWQTGEQVRKPPQKRSTMGASL